MTAAAMRPERPTNSILKSDIQADSAKVSLWCNYNPTPSNQAEKARTRIKKIFPPPPDIVRLPGKSLDNQESAALGCGRWGAALMPYRNERDVVIGSADCKIGNIFSVGPYGARVSFASQQHRTLNLVWAILDRADRLARESNKPIPKDFAVIGGGIAGVMAAVCLIARERTVWLFEKGGHVLNLQEGAHHRFVHPTINFWPESPLKWTTAFPFMDWAAGPCVDVIETMRREWKQHYADMLPEDLCNSDVQGLRWDSAKKKVLVDYNREGVSSTKEVDMAFVTTGFGEERNLGDDSQRSYWQYDDVKRWADQTGKTFVVSGTGDGGVIDALRLAYPGFMDDELALSFLEAIDTESLRAEVAAVEADAQDIADLNKRSLDYSTKYTEIALKQPLVAKNLLLDLKRGKRPVILLGEREAPFDVSAAPIHKIILAHALHKQHIIYKPGKLDRSGDKYIYHDLAGNQVDLHASHFIVRHGAEPPIAKFLGKPVADRLLTEQSVIGDWLEMTGRPNEFFDNLRISLKNDPHDVEYVKRRSDQAGAVLRNRYRFAGSRVNVDGTTPYFEAIHYVAKKSDSPHVPRHPIQLFGVQVKPVAYSSREVASHLVGER